MSIFPYIYYMIESFHMTDDNRKIALFAGLVTSVFAFCEFLCGIPWGWASDRFGRKPILLTGLAGTGISMIVFGLAPNFATALIARALGGLLNGNIGVIHTTVGEVVTVEKHQARGYSIIPMVWCVGSVLGSAIGGVMADPVRNYGWSEGTIWARFPFLLPNLFCTGIVVLGMVVGILFLEETHEDLKHNRDRGLEAGEWILSLFGNSPAPKLFGRKGDYTEEIFTFLHEDTDCPPDYRSTASSPELSPSAAPVGLPPPAYEYIEGLPRDSMDLEALAREAEIEKRNASLSYAFTKQVVLIIASYGILA
jgi:MFS family permease